MFLHGLDDGFAYGRSARVRGENGFLESSFAKSLVRGIHGVGDAVGKENHLSPGSSVVSAVSYGYSGAIPNGKPEHALPISSSRPSTRRISGQG